MSEDDEVTQIAKALKGKRVVNYRKCNFYKNGECLWIQCKSGVTKCCFECNVKPCRHGRCKGPPFWRKK